MTDTYQGNSQEQEFLQYKLQYQTQLRSFEQIFPSKQIIGKQGICPFRILNIMQKSMLIDCSLSLFEINQLSLANKSKSRILQIKQFQSFYQEIIGLIIQKSQLFQKFLLFGQSYENIKSFLSNIFFQIVKSQLNIKSQLFCPFSAKGCSLNQMNIQLNRTFILPQLIDQYFQHNSLKMQNKNQFPFGLTFLINKCIPNTISTVKKQNCISNSFSKHYFRASQNSEHQCKLNMMQENNCQGSFTFFSAYQDQPLLILKRVNKALRKSCIFSLKPFWNQQFQKYLLSLLKNNDIYFLDSFPFLLIFLRLNEFKMFCLQSQLQDDLYEKIFPGLNSILTSIQQRLQVNSFKDQIEAFKEMMQKKKECRQFKQMSDKQLNDLFLEQYRNNYKIDNETQTQKIFLKQLKYFIRITKKGIIKIGNKFIKQFDQHLNNYLIQLRRTFEKVIVDQLALSIRSVINQYLNLYKFNNIQQQQSFENYFYSIENQPITQSKCMGCSRVFVINKSIYDPTVSAIPLKHFPTIHKLKDYEVEFKDTICAMLNNGGGVILFDCYEINQNIYARGQCLTQKQKQQIQQRITSYFRWFYPRPEINTNIKISFIPIISNIIKIKQQKHRNEYLDGVYVTRLRIAPSYNQKLYFWFNSKKQVYKEDRQEYVLKYFSILDNKNNPKLVNLGQARRLIKKRVVNNYVCQLQTQNAFMMRKPVNIFGHQCQQPQTGQQMTQIKNKYQIISQPEQIRKKKGNLSALTTLQSKFNYVTLLIARKEELAKIKQKLIDANVQCQIEIRFAKHNLKPANNAAILYHDKNFEVIHNLITNDPRFRFSSGKTFMTINVTKYLRFQGRNQRNRLDNNTMLRHKEWLKKQFQDQKINFYQYDVDHKKKEYYLQASSKLSLLFMYFIINHNGEKVSFKNPYNLEKYSISDKATQFKKINAFKSDQNIDKQANFFKQKSRQQSLKYIGQEIE